MADPSSERIFGVPWLALAGIALVIAVAYAFVPGGAGAVDLRWFVLRWLHTIAWLLLALAALVRAKVTGLSADYAAPLAAAGGLLYVILMLTTLAGEG